jgi:acyl carrier protein
MHQETGGDPRRSIREYLAESCFVDMSEIDDDASFTETGILDSVRFLEMVAFLERTFKIEVHDDEVVPANMDSVARVVRYLHRKTNGQHR